MILIDDDVKLFGLLSRYCDEPDELKKQVVAYVAGGAADVAGAQKELD